MISPSVRILFLLAFLVSSFPAANAGTPVTVEPDGVPKRHNEATVAQLQAEMASGRLTSEALTKEYIARIVALDQNGPGVNAVIELNPDALVMAKRADQLRRHGIVLGPLHGIPVLLKDNVDTGDKMQTTAGSFALAGRPALADSTVAANLRAGGAVILGKTNLSEWANFRSFESISGWSGRGGQTNNPYGINRNPCGSSSGSGAAASSNFATISFGTETDGSIVCPANANGVVGIKPTVGLTSRAGIRRRGGAWRGAKPQFRWARSCDRRRAAGMAGTIRSSHEHSGRVHTISELAWITGCAHRSYTGGTQRI